MIIRWWDTKTKMDGGVLDDGEMRAFWKRASQFARGNFLSCRLAGPLFLPPAPSPSPVVACVKRV